MTYAFALKQDHSVSGIPRLQRLDLLSDEDKELATLDGYEGGLSVSPSGKKVAYYIDKEILRFATSLHSTVWPAFASASAFFTGAR